jgi:hypothetical protein
MYSTFKFVLNHVEFLFQNVITIKTENKKYLPSRPNAGTTRAERWLLQAGHSTSTPASVYLNGGGRNFGLGVQSDY